MSGGMHLLRLRVMRLFVPRALFARSTMYSHVSIPHWPIQTVPLGKKILKRRFDFAGCSVEMPGRIVWRVESASQEWHRQFYNFWWLNEISAGKHNREAASFAREFVNCFILERRDQPSAAWETDVAGMRLYHWFEHFDFLMRGSSRVFRQRFARSILQHVLFLAGKLQEPSPEMLSGLLAAARRCGDFAFLLPEITRALKVMLPATIFPDGSHRSGSPQRHLEALRILINIQNLMPQDNLMYADLTLALQKMGSMLQFFTHGDGRLALFNDSIMEDAGLITKVFERSGASEIFPVESDAGFCHLRRKKTSVILQVSLSPVSKCEGMLSFEMSDGVHRLVTNCGHYLGTDEHWVKAVRSAAAHSTLSLDSESFARKEAQAAAEPSAIKEEHPLEVASEAVLTGEQFNHIFVSAFSEHYAASHGLRHKRYLKLSSKGDKLNGTDSLLREEVNPKITGHLRFHLHPDLRAVKLNESKVQLTTLAGATWFFEVHSPQKVALEESVYLGHNGRPQKTLQLMLKLELAELQTEVLWSFTKKGEAALGE